MYKKSRKVRDMECKTLQGLGKMERLTREMEQCRLAVFAVTETHLPGKGEMLLD